MLVSYWTLAQSSAGFTILGTEAISKEAMSDGDVDAVTKDTGYGRVLGEIIRDWGVACAKRRAECLIKLVSKTVPNISTASGGGRLATIDLNHLAAVAAKAKGRLAGRRVF